MDLAGEIAIIPDHNIRTTTPTAANGNPKRNEGQPWIVVRLTGWRPFNSIRSWVGESATVIGHLLQYFDMFPV